MSGEVSDFMKMDYPNVKTYKAGTSSDSICSGIICDYCRKKCRLDLYCIDAEYEGFEGKLVFEVKFI